MQYVILLVTLLILAANVLFGIKRGLFRTLLRLGTVLLAFVAAFFLSKMLSAMAAATLRPVLESLLSSNTELADFLAQNPEVGDSLGALLQMFVTPLLFLLCYMLLKCASWLAYFLLRLVCRVKKGRGLGSRVLGGALAGFCVGVVGVLVFVTPVMGYTDLLSRTATESPSLTATLNLTDYNEKYLIPAADAPIASLLYKRGGERLFTDLTTSKLGDAETDLNKEWFSVLHVINEASKLGKKPVAEFGQAESEAAHAMATGVGESRILSNLGGSAIKGIASTWLQDGSFMGIAKPATGDESVDLILNGFLTVLATTSPAQISDDLNCFADLFDLFIRYEVFSKIGEGDNTDALVTQLATSGFLDDARRLLAENQRMEPVVTAISDAGMRLLVRELGDPATYLEEHKELLDGMSGKLKEAAGEDGKIDTATLSTGIQEELAKQNVTVPAAATDIIAEGIADEFAGEDLSSLTVDEITSRLVERFGSVENISQFYDVAADAEN